VEVRHGGDLLFSRLSALVRNVTVVCLLQHYPPHRLSHPSATELFASSFVARLRLFDNYTFQTLILF
jgi:hypothetical protein